MKVLHIMTGELSSGAARGTYWLHLGLCDYGIDSKIFTNSRDTLGDSNIITILNSSKDRFWNIIRRKLDSSMTKLYPKRKKYIFSCGMFGVNITKTKEYQEADIIHLHWINDGFINIKYLSKINKPIVWTMRDMWPMTGGCHYAMNCDNYKTGCGNCEQLGSNKKYDLSRYIYIIIDCGSSDATVEIIQKYDDKIDYRVSEPDEDICYAMNKRIKLYTGEYIGIINSDDYYKLDAIENVVKVFDSGCDFVYGSILRIYKQKKACRIMYPFKEQDINKKKFHRIPFPHPSLFINKKVYKQLGFFDTSYNICSDYDYILKMLKNNLIGKDSKKLIAVFRDGGLSSIFYTFIEEKNILISHNAGRLFTYKRFLSSVIRFSIKMMFVKIMPN